MTNPNDHTAVLLEVREALKELINRDGFDEYQYRYQEQAKEALTRLDAFLADVPEDINWAAEHLIVDSSDFEDNLRAARIERAATKLLAKATQEESDARD